MVVKIILSLLFLFIPFAMVEEQAVSASEDNNMPVFGNVGEEWADSILNNMTIDEKIGQLFMIAAYSNKDKNHEDEIIRFINQYHIGGLIFFQGTAMKQVQLINTYQDTAKYPLMIGFDGEWGLGMRLDETQSFPRQLTLGAIQKEDVIYEMGKEIGRQMQQVGINVNFAPVVDINNNVNNPVINDRSFGEDRVNVALKSSAYMDGLQDAGILACAKHFPGHGDTDVDSHYDLPIINHDRKRLDSLELFPFRHLISKGVGSVMVAHLNIPALDNRENRPSTMSEKIIGDLLKGQLNFNGLIFTDALQMKGVTKFFDPGETEVQAFLAGNDVLLYPEYVPIAIQKMKAAYSAGLYTEERLDHSVKKILKAKSWCGLDKRTSLIDSTLESSLHMPSALKLERQLIEQSITVARNESQLIPLKKLADKKIACVTIGKRAHTPFAKMLDNYAPIKHYYADNTLNMTGYTGLLNALRDYDVVYVNYQGMSRYASKKHGIAPNSLIFMESLLKQNEVILVLFGTPYALDKFPGQKNVVVAYQDTDDTQEICAQILFGGRSASGRLPVSSGEYKYADGVNTEKMDRLAYVSKAEMDLPENAFDKIDSISEAAIKLNATPGLQMVIAKDNKVFYQKSFGKHTYDAASKKTVDTDLYDLASLTKIVATTPTLMKLQEDKRINIKGNLGDYLLLPDTSDKKDLILEEILAHQAKLPGWIPFYRNTYNQKGWKSNILRDKQDEEFCIQVAEGVWICQTYIDTMWNRIETVSLRKEDDYKYSDIGFYYFKELIEKKYEKPLQQVVDEWLYSPLGLSTMTYLPLSKFTADRIVPTESDKVFRKTLIQGHVHDPGAAMMGGIGGHAGLFSNANDLAIYMQMLMNGGSYGGEKYLEPETIDYFTSTHFQNNRRGLGFDKPDPDRVYGSSCDDTPLTSFGHTGFTGTMAWADPDNGIVFIFLSNRVHPSAENTRLLKDNVRTKIHQEVYNLFNIGQKEKPAALED